MIAKVTTGLYTHHVGVEHGVDRLDLAVRCEVRKTIGTDLDLGSSDVVAGSHGVPVQACNNKVEVEGKTVECL